MLHLADLSVRKKLYASFGVVVALLVAVVVVGFTSMRGLESAHTTVAATVLPQVIASDTARTAAADMHFSQTRYVVEGTKARADYLDDRGVFVDDLEVLRKLT